MLSRIPDDFDYDEVLEVAEELLQYPRTDRWLCNRPCVP